MSGGDHGAAVSVCVFARTPVPGQVKTRLVPALGADGAARLHTAMTRHVATQARLAGTGPVRLCCTPSVEHPFFAALGERPGVTLRLQRGDDLGARMAAAVEEALSETDAVILVGADCPYLEPGDFMEAAEHLRGGAGAVVVPALDGGYVLLGLSAPLPALFQDMPWGTSEVMARTRERLVASGVAWREMNPRPDVDRPDDLPVLASRFPHLLAAAGLEEHLP